MCYSTTSTVLFICLLPLATQLTPSHSRQTEVAHSGENDNEDEDEEQLDGHGIEMKTLLHPLPSADLVESDSAESLAFNDPTHVQLTLQVLGLMCDGQNRNLQVSNM